MGNFRLNCSWDEFVSATDQLNRMLKEGKAFLLFGVQSVINLKINGVEELDSSVKKIIQNEVLFLVRESIESSGIFDSEDLIEYLISENIMDEKEMEDIITQVKNKFEYVYEVIVNSDMQNRYQFKNETVLNKISKMKCNYSKFILDDGTIQKHAIIQLGVCKDISLLENNSVSRMIGKFSDEDISFTCDAEDLDYFIFLLNKIKKEMEEL